jgi:hypothetical protein
MSDVFGQGIARRRGQLLATRSSALVQMDAKLLYSIKMCLRERQIQERPRGTITAQRQIKPIQDFVIFVTHIYSMWWLTCTSAQDALWNDLKLYHRLLKYEIVSPQISKSAVRAFSQHFWYLTSEMVLLSLLSSKVPDNEKRCLADKLLSFTQDDRKAVALAPQQRFCTGFGELKFPQNVSQLSTLVNLVGLDSCRSKAIGG